MTETAKAALQTAHRVAVLTGAGVSAESGVPVFRGPNGLWQNYRAEDLATPQAYARDPSLVWEWYRMRLHAVLNAEPNRAHRALAQLAKSKNLTLVTQNVDGLHALAGSEGVLELHGNLTQSRCEHCGHLDVLSVDFALPPHCSTCSSRARPNVVWFGETLPQATFQAAVNAFAVAEVALVVGTSAVVEPAASLARVAKQRGAFVIEINPEQTPLTYSADFSLTLPASAGLAALLDGHEADA